MYSAVLMLAWTAGSDSVDFAVAAAMAVRYSCSSSYGCSTSLATLRGQRLFSGSCSSRAASSAVTVIVAATGYVCSSSYGCSTSYGCSAWLPQWRPVPRRSVRWSRQSWLPRRHAVALRLQRRRGSRRRCAAGGTIVVPTKPEGYAEGEPVKEPKKPRSTPRRPSSSAPDRRSFARRRQPDHLDVGSSRWSPTLMVGSTYIYNMTAEIVREGRTVTQTQQVAVRSGETSTINFSFPTTQSVSTSN